MQPSDSIEAEESVMVLAYFDGDRPVFRAASAPLDDEALLDEEEGAGRAGFSGGIPRDISYEIEDEEPVYRSLGALNLGGDSTPVPEPPSLSRQRGFGAPGIVD